MKKIIFTGIIAVSIYACGNGNNEASSGNTAEDTVALADQPAKESLSANPDYQKGLELVAQSDCLTCHKVDDVNVGPSYRDVANKYEATPANISMLADKIIKGGTGNWGQVPMTPHPTLTTEDAEQMVKYIFLLKNK